jgi:hypothetical protein
MMVIGRKLKIKANAARPVRSVQTVLRAVRARFPPAQQDGLSSIGAIEVEYFQVCKPLERTIQRRRNSAASRSQIFLRYGSGYPTVRRTIPLKRVFFGFIK